MAEPVTTFTLPAGTVCKRNGVPFMLQHATQIECAPGAWTLISIEAGADELKELSPLRWGASTPEYFEALSSLASGAMSAIRSEPPASEAEIAPQPLVATDRQHGPSATNTGPRVPSDLNDSQPTHSPNTAWQCSGRAAGLFAGFAALIALAAAAALPVFVQGRPKLTAKNEIPK